MLSQKHSTSSPLDSDIKYDRLQLIELKFIEVCFQLFKSTTELFSSLNNSCFLLKPGVFFWDYGNSFLLEGRRAGANVDKNNGEKNSIDFKYPSYVQDIMGWVWLFKHFFSLKILKA